MTTLSDIIAPSALLTVDNTKTVTNKTISGASNTITNLNASNLSSGTVATARLASGTASSSTYLRGDQTWAAAGLDYFSDAESTAVPNNPVYVDSLSATGAATNVDVALVAKGTGATLAQIPDGTTAGGNKRGQYATDWSKYRPQGSDYVASGSYSTVSGGASVKASGAYSTASGGYVNVASGTYSTVIGGYSNQNTSGSYSTAGGYNSYGIGEASVAIGYSCRADTYSVAFGYRADTKDRPSCFSFGGYNRGDSGHPFQSSLMNVSAETTDATPTYLTGYTTDAATYWNRLDSNSAVAFRIILIGHVNAAGDTKAWEFYGAVKRGLSAATCTLVGAVTKNIIAADSGASSWDADVVVDTSTGAFTVQVTGAASTTIRWNASMYTSESEY